MPAFLSLARVYASRCIGARRLSFFRAESRGVTTTEQLIFFLEMGCSRPLHQLMHTAILLKNETMEQPNTERKINIINISKALSS
jgi:hypothetical protein